MLVVGVDAVPHAEAVAQDEERHEADEELAPDVGLPEVAEELLEEVHVVERLLKPKGLSRQPRKTWMQNSTRTLAR